MAKKGQASSQEVQNAVKTLLANIRFMSVDNPLRSLVITSSVPNEGKTTVSIELARAIATSGRTVLLVECDMRRRSVADELGVHAQAGLHAVLTEQVQPQYAIVQTQTAGLYFLDSEPGIPNPPDLLASKRFKRLVSRLVESYDYVVFDTPPVGTFVDAAVLAAVADGTVLVVRENYTRRADVVDAYAQLQKAGANVVGAVMNYCQMKKSEYYYAYYNKDGKRVRKSSGSGHSHGSGSAGVSAVHDYDFGADSESAAAATGRRYGSGFGGSAAAVEDKPVSRVNEATSARSASTTTVLPATKRTHVGKHSTPLGGR